MYNLHKLLRSLNTMTEQELLEDLDLAADNMAGAVGIGPDFEDASTIAGQVIGELNWRFPNWMEDKPSVEDEQQTNPNDCYWCAGTGNADNMVDCCGGCGGSGRKRLGYWNNYGCESNDKKLFLIHR